MRGTVFRYADDQAVGVAGAVPALPLSSPSSRVGSAELLPGLLEALASGSASAGAPGDAASTAVDIDGETPAPGTGSADLLPTLLEGLLSGSAGTAPATPAA